MFQKMFLVFSAFAVIALGDTQCPVAPAIPEDRRANKTTIRLVQYNVEWLFIDYNANADCPGSQCSWHTLADAQTHLEYVSSVINTLKPDILNLCEVEGCDELKMLLNTTSPADVSRKPYLIQGTDTSTGQNVGLITKIDPSKDLYRSDERVSYPIPNSKCGYTGAPSTSGVSKHYISEFTIGTTKLALIGVHFLAFPLDATRCAEREAQAQVIQNVISKYSALKYEIIVMGDLNDFDGVVLDANNNVPVSQVLEILKGHAGVYEGTYNLISIASDIPKADRYSDWWDQNGNCNSTANEFSMIDHILVTAPIQDKIVNRFIYKGYAEFCGTYNSDHYPVVIDIML